MLHWKTACQYIYIKCICNYADCQRIWFKTRLFIFILWKECEGGTVVQWLALSPLPVQSLHVFPYSAADFLPQCKNRHARLIGDSTLWVPVMDWTLPLVLCQLMEEAPWIHSGICWRKWLERKFVAEALLFLIFICQDWEYSEKINDGLYGKENKADSIMKTSLWDAPSSVICLFIYFSHRMSAVIAGHIRHPVRHLLKRNT